MCGTSNNRGGKEQGQAWVAAVLSANGNGGPDAAYNECETKPLLVHCPNSRFNAVHRGTWKPSDPLVKRPTGILSRVRFPLRSRNLGIHGRPATWLRIRRERASHLNDTPACQSSSRQRGSTLMKHHLEPVQAPERNTPVVRDYATVCKGLADILRRLFGHFANHSSVREVSSPLGEMTGRAQYMLRFSPPRRR